MWEIVAASLISYVGKKAIDEFWSKRRSGKHSVLNQAGNIGYASLDAGRIRIEKDLTVSQFQEYETLFGNLYIPDTIEDLLTGDEIALVLVIEETYQHVFLFEKRNHDGQVGYHLRTIGKAPWYQSIGWFGVCLTAKSTFYKVFPVGQWVAERPELPAFQEYTGA